jgi:chromosome segregation ATPase
MKQMVQACENMWSDPYFGKRKKEEYDAEFMNFKRQDTRNQRAIRRLNKEVEKLTEEVQEQQALIGDMTAHTGDLERYIADLGLSPDEPVPTVKEYLDTIEKLRGEVRVLEDSNKLWESQFGAGDPLLCSKDELQGNYNAQLKVVLDSSDKKEDQILALRKEKRGLVAKGIVLSKVAKDLEQAKEEITELQRRLEKTDVDLSNEDARQILQSRVLDLEMQLKVVKADVGVLEQKAETDTEAFQKRISDLEAELEATKEGFGAEATDSSELETLRNQINELKKELEDQKLMTGDCEERSTNQLKKISELEVQTKDLEGDDTDKNIEGLN